MCRSKTMGTVGTVQAEDVSLGTIQAKTPSSDDQWIVTLSVNSTPVEFKIDTGPDVSVIPEAIFNKIDGVTLKQTSRSLSGPSNLPLHICGQFTGTLNHWTVEIKEETFVVRGLEKALMGRPAITALGLVSRVNAIEKKGEKFVARYPDFFQLLGTFEGEYHIKLKGEAKSFALMTPRRVALLLLPKVKEELLRMEQLGVITRVDKPTDWCMGTVVVPKTDRKVCICVDLTRLNESVCRERLILPSVEQILAQLSGAKVFTKLDSFGKSNCQRTQLCSQPSSPPLAGFASTGCPLE